MDPLMWGSMKGKTHTWPSAAHFHAPQQPSPLVFRVRVIVAEVLETKKKATLYKGAFLLQSVSLIVIIGSMVIM